MRKSKSIPICLEEVVSKCNETNFDDDLNIVLLSQRLEKFLNSGVILLRRRDNQTECRGERSHT